MVLLATLSGNAFAQIQPSSLKAGAKYKGTSSCPVSGPCERYMSIVDTGKLSFDIPASISDQFNADTVVYINSDFDSYEFRLGEDAKYQSRAESVKVAQTVSQQDFEQKASYKLSWK